MDKKRSYLESHFKSKDERGGTSSETVVRLGSRNEGFAALAKKEVRDIGKWMDAVNKGTEFYCVQEYYEYNTSTLCSVQEALRKALKCEKT